MKKYKYILEHPLLWIVNQIIKLLFKNSFFIKAINYQNYVSFDFWFIQKILNIGGNKNAYWPVHYTSKVVYPERILVGIDTSPGIMKGCYIQGEGGIDIGDYTQVAPNVFIVSSNHDVYDSRFSIQKKVVIGKYCWLGAGCKILPGVTLGDFTIVGAGAVVTKSFPEGYCIIGEVPAKKLKELEIERCDRYELQPKFHGYIPEKNFDNYRKKHLNI